MGNANQCPGCSGSPLATDIPGVFRCDSCGGVFGECTYPVALKYVKVGIWAPVEVSADNLEYVDLDILWRERKSGTPHLTRWHGWVDRKTRKVVQTG